VTVAPLRSPPVITVHLNRDDTGTLMFGHSPWLTGARYSGGWSSPAPAFWNIERPLEVYQLIRRQMGEA
jgi:hypothetical protein